MTPLANHFRGVADRHARSGYAGGSWRASGPIRLGAAIRFQSLYRQLADQNRFDRAHAGARHNSDDDRHAPTWRTGLAKMIVDRDVPTVNGMPVHGSVRMNVSHNTRGVAPIWEATCRITKVSATLGFRRICRRLNIGCLQGKFQHRGDHHDDDAPMEPRLGADAQPYISKSLHKAGLYPSP